MLTKRSNWLLKISTGPITLACLAIFLIFSVLVQPDQAAQAEIYSAEVGSPDTSLYYTASDLNRMAEAYGSQGRTAYIRARFSFDLIFPLVYTAFLVTAISWLIKRSNLDWRTWGLLNLLPVMGMLFDFLENISTSIVMARYPQSTVVVGHLAGVFTLFKWLFIGASFLVLLFAGVIVIWSSIKRKPM